MNQLVGIGVAWSLAIIGTLAALKIVDMTVGLRVAEGHEILGLDLPTFEFWTLLQADPKDLTQKLSTAENAE